MQHPPRWCPPVHPVVDTHSRPTSFEHIQDLFVPEGEGDVVPPPQEVDVGNLGSLKHPLPAHLRQPVQAGAAANISQTLEQGHQGTYGTLVEAELLCQIAWSLVLLSLERYEQADLACRYRRAKADSSEETEAWPRSLVGGQQHQAFECVGDVRRGFLHQDWSDWDDDRSTTGTPSQLWC